MGPGYICRLQRQALPERLHDKPLFPHVAFRNLGLHVNLGPHLSKELPFKCRTVAGAAKDDLRLIGDQR